jgi:hypothetical protein
MERRIWNFIGAGGHDVMLEWADALHLDPGVRAKLDGALEGALDRLRRQGFDILLHTNAVAGPIMNDIYALRVNGPVAARVLFCRGPLPGEDAFTLLAGAVEQGRKLSPADAPENAARNRELALKEPAHRRKLYDGFGKAAD